MARRAMVIGLADGAAVAWPLLVAIAGAVLLDRRRDRRRRTALNRALHELRRPLQFLALAGSAPWSRAGGSRAARAQLEAALAALDDLDSEINGRRSTDGRRPLRADGLAGEAVARWRWSAALLGREIELHWNAGEAVVLGDRRALSRALDNLIANSLEHGTERIRIEGTTCRGRLRIAVADGLSAVLSTAAPLSRGGARNRPAGPAAPLAAAPGRDRAPGRDGDPRRGHGLALVARIASLHGGRFAFSRRGSTTCSVLELPLAASPARSLRHRVHADAA